MSDSAEKAEKASGKTEKIWEVRYFRLPRKKDEVPVKEGHQNKNAAINRARELSVEFGEAATAEITLKPDGTEAQTSEVVMLKQGVIVDKDGKALEDKPFQQPKPRAAAAPAKGKQEASTATKETEATKTETEKENDMTATSTATAKKAPVKVSAAAKKAPAKAAAKTPAKKAAVKAAAKKAAPAEAKVADNGGFTGKKGELFTALKLRPGTLIHKMGSVLIESLGSLMTKDELVKKVYGRGDNDSVKAMSGVVNGITDKLADAKMGYEFIKGGQKDKEGNTLYGIKSGA